jgi:Ca2+-binding RTX toxin-like protein
MVGVRNAAAAPATLHVDNTVTCDDSTSDSSVTPYCHIQAAVDDASAGDTIEVAAGTYGEDVTVNKTLTLSGAGSSSTTVSGPIGGPGSTFAVSASNVVIDGFLITRDGNNTTDWNDPTLNSAGVSIIGTALSGLEVKNCKLTGNRTGIDINNSSGHSVHNNVIDDNRTGMIFRNVTDNESVVNNQITNNWTVGIVFLDASGGTNSPLQTALNSTFSDNDISGNWYGQIVDRQTGGSLPAPGANPKNFSGNWFGTNSPVHTTANSAEPGYATQIPVEFGGTATPPGGQPDIAGPASPNFDYTPFLWTDTDTSPDFGFQGDFSSLGATSDGSQTGALGRLDEAIADVTTGGTVNVAAGTYAEHVTIGKKLELTGAGDTTVVDPSTDGPAITINAGGSSGDPLVVSQVKTTGATGSGNTGSGIRIGAGVTDVTISNVTSTGNAGHGLAVDTTGALARLTLDTVDFSSNTGDGIRLPSSMAGLDGLTITDSHFDNNGFAGMEIYGPASTDPVTNVSITNSTFSGDANKGIYAERLAHADLDGLTVDASGTSGSFAAGIDLNLKKQAFSDITIENSTIRNSGTGDTTNGVGIAIKSRDDGANGPTSVDGVTLTGNTLTGNQFGLRLGEPGKNNVGPTNVHVNQNNINGNVNGNGMINVTQTVADATCNWWGAGTGPGGAGPGSGDTVGTSITFSPWLVGPAPGGACTGTPPPQCNGKFATIIGGPGNTTINGTNGDDVIVDLDGNNKVNGKDGDDTICTGPGKDKITGGDGNDWIDAGDGKNNVNSGNDDDTVTTGSDIDTVNGADGDDDLTTGPGNDKVTGGDGNDTIDAGDGNNTVNSGSGDDNVTTGTGNDKISTGAGADTVSAGDGKNNVNGGPGDDNLTTGADNDTINGAGNTDECHPDGGTNTVKNCEVIS